MGVIFALVDSDPDSKSGSTDLIESGSNPDLDPKHCCKQMTKSEKVKKNETLQEGQE